MAKQNLAFRIKIEIAVGRTTERCELPLEALQGPRHHPRLLKPPILARRLTCLTTH
jgi:hypothetical protein